MEKDIIQLNKKDGVATLPVVLLIGGLITEIAIAGVIIAYFFGQSGLGIRLSAEALAAAHTGIQDASLRIMRDKNFAPSPNPYTITIDNDSAEITVCKDLQTVSSACDTAMSGKFEVTSLGSSLNKRRQLRAIISVDSVSGETRLESLNEIVI